jgi:2-oxoglutarate dehydrogenase E1 component
MNYNNPNSFLNTVDEEWIELLYALWCKSASSVPTDWQIYFSGFDLSENSYARKANSESCKLSGVHSLFGSYRTVGYLLACTDPLSPCQLDHPLLNLASFDLDSSDLDSLFSISGFFESDTSLREIVRSLKDTYCHEIGVEFMHIQDPAERQWLIDMMEPCRNKSTFSIDDQLHVLELLHRASLFEEFLQRHFPGQKRFSLEGGEVLIPVLDELVRLAPDSGVNDIVFGMAHRGRLNVLTHIFNKPYENIFAEFRDAMATGFIGDGDVKYHKGISTDVTLPDGSVHLTLVSNPSHLEAVNPVVEGKCRARQDRFGADGATKVLPVLIHGDAAFAGQGSIMETLNLYQLDCYSTGGTIHIVLNNQIGFTTLPHDARSTPYATDVAKMLACPIFHVQGESPEAAIHVIRLACEYRQRFKKDVVIELICYRRHGHNEGDEPAFSQPLMYQQIASRPTVSSIYADVLARSGVDSALLEAVRQRVQSVLAESLEKPPQLKAIGFHDAWDSVSPVYHFVPVDTTVPAEKLLLLARRLAELPPGFVPHAKIQSLIQKRFESVLMGGTLDWGTAETLAYATLLDQGVSVRLSGQDSRRGTFSHRHSVIHDNNNGSTYIPLATVAEHGASFQCWDSPLSEFGVLGFEYGYSLETPQGLTLWEAQFGDFANGAQVIIDQFIASGETKWNRASGLVLLLPHGYEGQGAEHSSARMERFLQLCAGNNMIVANPSTPAQMFHLLRRQAMQSFRKPLIIFTPKSLLRHPACVSTAADLCTGSFAEIMADNTDPDCTSSILVCSGKIYYDLIEERTRQGRDDTTIIRIEQLYPLRTDLLDNALQRYPDKTRISWVQEEPENMGAWHSIRPVLCRHDPSVRYVGRRADCCPAVGSHGLHLEQQKEIIRTAFDVAVSA